MNLYHSSLESHGSGPLRQFAIIILGLLIRCSIGGYGNIPAPIGSWRWLPRVSTKYRYTRLYWLNMEISLFYARAAKASGVLCGYTKVF